MVVPIRAIAGVELDLPNGKQIASARVTDQVAKFDLSWDRFVRLKAAAEVIQTTSAKRILDAGGYDGALAPFLSAQEVDVIDPATTGGSVLEIPSADNSYDAVVVTCILTLPSRLVIEQLNSAR